MDNTDTCIDTAVTRELTGLPVPTLNNLERQTISFLKALWAAQGKDKDIIDLSASSSKRARLTRGNDI